MHLEVKKGNETVPYFITAMDFHVSKGTVKVTVKPFASVEAHAAEEDPLDDGETHTFAGYPTGHVDPWVYDRLGALMGDRAKIVKDEPKTEAKTSA